MKNENKTTKTLAVIAASTMVIAGLSNTATAANFDFEDLGSGAELRSELINVPSATANSLELTIEAKCGEKTKEAKCGEKGKAKEAKCGEKGKAKEAKCGEKGKAKEAKCGEK
jgi:uncharacterized low-complexity protein